MGAEFDAVSQLSDDQLFARTLNDPSTEHVEEAIEELRTRGTRPVVERAMQMVRSQNGIERLVGIAVLNDFGARKNFPFRDEYALVLVGALYTDDEVQLARTINCVAKTESDCALEPLLLLSRHRSEAVRLSVAQGLPSFGRGERCSESDPMVSALLDLMDDQDEEVRNWATFGIGSQVSVDGPAIRSALRARLADNNDDARAEAVIGLVQRRDPCSYDTVLRELTNEWVGRLAVQAAALLGDERLASPLQDLASWWDVDSEGLAWATRRCAPGRLAQEVKTMIALDERFNRLTPGWSLIFESSCPDRETSISAQYGDQLLGHWSFDFLSASSNNDPEIAARRIRSAILEMAVTDGDLPRVKELLRVGCDPNEMDSLLFQPLWLEAFRGGNDEVVQAFADARADLNATDGDGRTTLHVLAGQSESTAAIERLLTFGVSVSIEDRNGWTALHSAACYGYERSVELLLAAGADPEAKTHEGKAPVDFAIVNGHIAVANLLRSET
jgi:Ankyrin repeats (3 copies)